MNVLVTGATGFLGTVLVNRLAGKGHTVYTLIRNRERAEAWLDGLPNVTQRAVRLVEGDVMKPLAGLEESQIRELKGSIDTVIHSAAYLSFDEAERERVFESNLEGTKGLLDAAERLDVRQFLHVSTAYTLGMDDAGAETLYETEGREFVNAYEESKCHAEHEVLSRTDRYHVAILRPAIIVGDSETGEADSTFGLYGVMRAVELMKRHSEKSRTKAADASTIVVSEEDETHLVPVDYVADVTVGAVTESENGCIYHVTNPNPPTNGMIMKAIQKGFDFPELKWVPFEAADHLSRLEQKMNEPLAVFEPYLNRTISFSHDNTNALLKRMNHPPLAMDSDMLERIVKGYRNRHVKAEEV